MSRQHMRRKHHQHRWTLLTALRSTAGAIDLASIMVGVIIVGVLAGVIAASVFLVIPWSQDEAAKGSLDSVKLAQGVAKVQEGRYLPSTGLVDAKLLPESPNVTTVTDGDGTCYVTTSVSASGAVFYQTSASSAVLTEAPDPGDCVPAHLPDGDEPGTPDTDGRVFRGGGGVVANTLEAWEAQDAGTDWDSTASNYAVSAYLEVRHDAPAPGPFDSIPLSEYEEMAPGDTEAVYIGTITSSKLTLSDGTVLDGAAVDCPVVYNGWCEWFDGKATVTRGVDENGSFFPGSVFLADYRSYDLGRELNFFEAYDEVQAATLTIELDGGHTVSIVIVPEVT